MSATTPGILPADRLNRRDYRVLLLWILAGVLGATVAVKYYFVAFPEASVNFKVSRSAALGIARDFLQTQGFQLEGYKSSIIFDTDEDAKTYLERSLGLERANQLMSSEISTWFWAARFFRPGQKEEFGVQVSPAGRVVGLDHKVEEGRAGASLGQQAALAVATQFLQKREQLDLAAYEFLPAEANHTDLPARRNWSFTWERRGFKAKDAPYRIQVILLGDQVGGYREFLKVPEAWLRDYQKLRSSNLLYQSTDQLFFFLLFGGALWSVYDLARRGFINWRGPLKIVAVVAALYVLMTVNQLSLLTSQYDTNSSYPGFFLLQLGGAILIGVFYYGLLIGCGEAAGEALYRHDQPQQLRLSKAFTLPGMRTKEFFCSCVIGLGLAGVHLGYVVLFYTIGSRHGVWAPQDINYSDVVNTAAPWLYPLTIGILAATSEEFVFRLFAIPFVLRFTKSRVLAVVLPAFVWGFLHSAYNVEPGYIRGIEVGTIGIVAGIVMLRWGILATLVWHYTVDATLISTLLLRSESLYFRVSGAIVGAAALIPLCIAGVSYLTRRRFETDEALLNRMAPLAEPAPAPVAQEAAPVQAVSYQVLAARPLWVVVLAGVIGAAFFAAVKVPAIGDFVRFSVDARQAGESADSILRQRSPEAGKAVAWHRAVSLESTYNPYVNEYLRRQIGMAAANDLYKNEVPSVFWKARYFRDAEKEEYWVLLGPDGSLHSIHHLLDERTPGANLTKEEAQGHAEAYLREVKKLSLVGWKLVKADSEKKPARTDHDFEWEKQQMIGAPPSGYKEGAHVRVEVHVLGDEVSGYRTYVKIPEEWERQQSELTFATILQLVFLVAVVLAFIVVVLVLFFKSLRDPAATSVPWRSFARWAMIGFVAFVAGFAVNLQSILTAYNTEWPLKTFFAALAISFIFGAGIVYSGLIFLFGLAWFFLTKAFGPQSVPRWRGMPPAYYGQAVLLAIAGTGLLAGLTRLTYMAQKALAAHGRSLEAEVPLLLGSSLPALSAAKSAVLWGLFLCGLVGLAGGFVARYAAKVWMQAGLILLLALALTTDWGSPQAYASKLVINYMVLAILWLGAAKLMRFNALAYFLLAATATLVPVAVQLLSQPSAFYRANGVATAILLAALLVWPLLVMRHTANAGSAITASEPSA